MISLKNLSIAQKVYFPIIFTIFVGLAIILSNTYINMQDIENKARLEMVEQMRSYINTAINEKKQISLTNAINLSLNESVRKALESADREKAIKYLNEISKEFGKNTDYKNIKIHLHDADIKSFVRQWKPKQYGDELAGFRSSLKYVKKYRRPIAVVESGRAGMLIRGVAPILKNGNYLGSVEFIQNFDLIVKNAKKERDFSLLFLTYKFKNIKRFDTNSTIIDGMYLSQSKSSLDTKLLKSLKKFDLSKVDKQFFAFADNYFYTAVKLYNINKKNIGVVLIMLPNSKVNTIVNRAKKGLLLQIWVIMAIDILILLLLLLVLYYAIKQPINRLNTAMENIKETLSSEDDFMQLNRFKIKMDCKDEICSIAYMINRLLKTLMREFVKAQKASRMTKEYVKAVGAGSIVSKSDLDGNITYVNQALCDATGYTQEELIGKPHSIFRHANTPKRTFKELWKTIQSGNIWHGLLKNRRKDGSTFYANVTIVPIKNTKGKIVEYVALRDDVTELVNSKEELKKTFLTDALTSFGNRFKMLNTLKKYPNSSMAIVDIHYFKEINDFYGYEIGDAVIVTLANRLFAFFNNDKTEVFHIGGDEFAVVSFKEVLSEDEFLEKMKLFFKHNNHSELDIKGKIIALRLTCGISGPSDNLINHADIAHKNAKKFNKDIVVYKEDISTDEDYKKNLECTLTIKNAIDDNRVVAVYQPIYSNKTKKIDKYETLMRIKQENGELLSPFHFLDVAKKTRYYKTLTRIIVEKAFKEFENRDDEFSINLSAEDIILHDVSEFFFDMASRYGVQNRVVVELVESEGIESFDMVETFIQKAKSLGMKIAIDDFGTGYSNFEYLIKLSTDYIKIDGSLIKEIAEKENMYSVVETIVSFAKNSNIKTIAEFVATKEIQEKVQKLGIDYSQGYYHGKPDFLKM